VTRSHLLRLTTVADDFRASTLLSRLRVNGRRSVSLPFIVALSTAAYTSKGCFQVVL